jgi:hypothetical protein
MLDDQTRQRLEGVRFQASGIGPLPTAVRILLDEERVLSDGNLSIAIERLCRRLADDASLADQRGQLVRWLLSAELSDRLLPWGWRRDATTVTWQVPQPWKTGVRNRPKS